MLNLSRKLFCFVVAFFGFLASQSQSSHALSVTLPADFYLEGDASIIPFLPVADITISDTAANQVRFDLVPTSLIKFDNLGLGLDASINEAQLVLTAITPDQMSLDTGGWLGFPFKINFDDKPMTAVSFFLSAPGLDVSDFLHLPATAKYPTTNFALRFWFDNPNLNIDGPIDATVGHDPSSSVPEPMTLVLLSGGLVGLGARRRMRRN